MVPYCQPDNVWLLPSVTVTFLVFATSVYSFPYILSKPLTLGRPLPYTRVPSRNLWPHDQTYVPDLR